VGAIWQRAKRVGSVIAVLRNFWWLSVGVIGLVIAGILGARSNPEAFGWTGVVVSYLVAAALGGLMVWLTVTNQREGSEYSWLEADYTYLINAEDPRRQRNSIRVKIEARRDNVTLFKNRYAWTGEGGSDLKLKSEDHRLLTVLMRDADWHYYYVIFGHPLRRRASTTVEIEQELYDSAGAFQPFYSKEVIEPLKALTLRVILPSNLEPRNIVGVEMTLMRRLAEWRIAGERPLEINPATGEVVFTVDRPVVGRRYQILWNWTGYPHKPLGGLGA